MDQEGTKPLRNEVGRGTRELEMENEATDSIKLDLTADEIRELFSRCLSSPEPDNSVSRDAMLKLARVLDQLIEPPATPAPTTNGIAYGG